MRDVYVEHCTGNGLYMDNVPPHFTPDQHFYNCYFSANNENGVLLDRVTDSHFNGCVFFSNVKNGIVINSQANALVDCKSYLNGIGNGEIGEDGLPIRYDGFVINAGYTLLTSCEAQENYGNGFFITSINNSLGNCKADGNGITGFKPDGTRKTREETGESPRFSGFLVKNAGRTRISGIVTNFIDSKYGVQEKSGIKIITSNKTNVNLCIADNKIPIAYELENTTISSCSIIINNETINHYDLNINDLLTLEDGYVLDSSTYAERIGNEVIIKLLISKEDNISPGANKIAVLKSSYRPLKDLYGTNTAFLS